MKTKKYFITAEKLDELKNLKSILEFEIDKIENKLQFGSSDDFISELMKNES